MDELAKKTLALKKAYAEIILNTAKEAAARVTVSERKALRFQHDLLNTKDDALRMLLRLKHMIDDKTTEEHITSLSQQRRIEELDSQLNEVEGVIVDLRAELRKANDQLEAVKKSQTRRLNGPTEHNDSHHCKTTIHGNQPDITKRNQFDEKLIPEDAPDYDICTKKEPILNGDERNLTEFAPFSIDAENIDTKDIYTSGIVAKDQPIKVQRLPRSRVRYAQSNTNPSRFGHCRTIEPATKPEQDEKSTENGEQTASLLRRSLRKRKVRCWDGISSLFKSRSSSSLSRCNKYATNESFVEKDEVSAEKTRGFSSGNLVNETDNVLAENNGDRNGLLKYTFSRKRKKDLVSKSDNCSSLEKMGEIPSSSPETDKCFLAGDSSSEIRNMVEVASQLISLSGKSRR